MLQRVAFGALAIAVLLFLVVADAVVAARAGPPENIWSRLLAHGSLIPATCALLVTLVCYELGALLRPLGARPSVKLATLASLALVLAPWLSAGGCLGVGPATGDLFAVQFVLTAAALLAAAILNLAERDLAQAARNITATWLIIGYAGVLGSFLVLLRCDQFMPGQLGAWVVLVTILVCKVSDIGAYFVGTLCGRHKLIPHVSPAKSIEGFLGGVLASGLLSWGLRAAAHAALALEDAPAASQRVDNLVQMLQDATVIYHKQTALQAFIFGALMAIAGQIGDLVESLFKRGAGVKDSGRILPSFGGILDILDSPLAAAPLAWFVLTRLWAVI